MFTRLLMCICMVFMLSSCAVVSGFKHASLYYQSVESLLEVPQFQKENLPIRILSVVVYAEVSTKEEEIRKSFHDASLLLEGQIGVRLDVARIIRHDWSNHTFSEALEDLERFRAKDNSYDIFAAVIASEECNEYMCWKGRARDSRNIALHISLHKEVIAHEVGHVLLQHGKHSPLGLMRAIGPELYMTVIDRQEILERKWRNMRESTSMPRWPSDHFGYE